MAAEDIALSARLFRLCSEVGCASPDPETKVGCVIVAADGSVKSTACNAPARGLRISPDRAARPGKYLWFEHAERNAIYEAARTGTALQGCTLYTELMPCIDCARAIIQAGICEVVVSKDRMAQYASAHYRDQHPMAEQMLKEAGISVRWE